MDKVHVRSSCFVLIMGPIMFWVLPSRTILNIPPPSGLHALLGLAVAIIIIGFICIASRDQRIVPSSSFGKAVLSVLGALAGVIAIFTTMVLFTDSIIDPAPFDRRTLFILQSIDTISFIYFLLCLFFIWNRFIVHEGMVVLRKGQLLYPCTKFTLGVIFREKVEMISTEVDVTMDFLIPCRNGDFLVSVKSSFTLDVEKAKKENITTINIDEIKKSAKKDMCSKMVQEAKKVTSGTFLRKNIHMTSDRAGFPIIWEIVPGKHVQLIK